MERPSKNNGDRIVQNTLPKNQRIKVDVNVQFRKNGKNGDGIRGRDYSTEV